MSILLSSPGVTDSPDSEGRTALMWAAQRGNYKVLEVMLQKEVDVHAFDNLGGTGGWGGRGLGGVCDHIMVMTLKQYRY